MAHLLTLLILFAIFIEKINSIFINRINKVFSKRKFGNKIYVM